LPSGESLQTHNTAVMVMKKTLDNISLTMTMQQRLFIPKYLLVESLGAYVTVNSISVRQNPSTEKTTHTVRSIPSQLISLA
jgi:hypothetical protein